MAGARSRTHPDDLSRYWAKRNFGITPEPRGDGGTAPAKQDSFVVQKHAARRLHYDFRLELDGVLKSWAVTKGPSLDPADKRLAVHVEDHPIEYAGFEGIIPQGQYGGGTVMVWDFGTWEPIGDARQGYKAGRLKFHLNGRKLKGGWMLVRMGGRARQERVDNWLLIKERDAEARPGEGSMLLEEQSASVTTGRSMDQIAASADRVWTASGERAGTKIAAKRPAKSQAASTEPKASAKRRPTKAASAMPDFVPPELPTLIDQPPEGPEWLHEIKLDGYRVLSRIAGGRTRFLTRTGQDWTHRFSALAAVKIAADEALIDGEIVVMTSSGVSSFEALQEALSAGRDDRLSFHAFDLLYLDGTDLREMPLSKRKNRLKALLQSSGAEARIAFNEHIEGRGARVFDNACSMALEGIVSKRRDAPYRPGRGTDWVKTKCSARQEFVIGGFTDSTTKDGGIGALLIGYYEDEALIYAGRVGTGFNAETRRELNRQLRKLLRKTPAFSAVPTPARRGAHWVEPRLVAEIAYSNWTRDGVLRHPSFQGLRMDKPPTDVFREQPKKPESKKRDSAPPRRRAAAGKRSDTIGGVPLSHPDRVLYAEQGLTKHDLAAYYAEVAEAMLPHLAGRPLSMVRCPDGMGKACFYQKHPGQHPPEALRRVSVTEKSGTREYFVVENLAGLISLVQIGVLEIHPWGSRAEDLDHPDRIIFDLDPDSSVPWERVIAAAGELRDRLTGLGLESFLKTTGGKGLHVVAPIAPRDEWPAVKAFTKAVAMAMDRDTPGAYTTVMSKQARRGRIFVDYLRNDRGSTAIAPFSTRARPGAPVATPLSWRELRPSLEPAKFNVLTVPKRLKSRGADPWAEMGRLRQPITAKARAQVGLK